MVGFDYHAFLSYSTQADYLLARDLEGFLGRFHELPMPDSTSLKQLRVWRDETGRSVEGSGFHMDIAKMLEENLGRCRYLVLLWSIHSLTSEWMRFEFEWFRTNRGTESILLGITNAPDPAGTMDTLFWPEIVKAGLLQRPWYDFRGFRKDESTAVIKLRDYEEARVQLAADLHGRSPAEIQPIWWRHKVREQQERAEREEQARRRLELTECNARLEAARGWYERAFVFFEQRRYRHCSRSLLNALAVAPRERVPECYQTSRSNPGWAEECWAFLRYSLALSPRLIRKFPQSVGADSSHHRMRSSNAKWLDGGNSFAVVSQSDAGPREEGVQNTANDGPVAIGDAIRVFSHPAGDLQATIIPPDGAGRITAWSGSRQFSRVAAGTERGWLCLWSAATGRTVSHRQHQAPLTAIDFSGGGDRVATGCARGEIRVWSELDDCAPMCEVLVHATDDPPESTSKPDTHNVQEKRIVEYIAFAQGDVGVVFLRNNQLHGRRFDSPDVTNVAELSLATSVTLDHAGRRVAYADGDVVRSSPLGSPRPHKPTDPLNSTKEEPLLYVGQHKSSVEQVVFSAHDRRLLTRDSVGKACVWLGRERELERGMTFMEAKMTQRFGRSNRGTLLKHLEGLGRINFLEPHPAIPDRLFICREAEIEEWDLGFGFEPIAGWKYTAKGSRCAAWLPSGQRVVVGSDDGYVEVFEIGASEPVRRMATGAAVGCLAVSQDGARIAIAVEDGAVRVLGTMDGAVLAEVQTPSAPFSVAFVKDERELGIGCADGTLFLWKWRSGLVLRRLGTVGDAVLGLAATPDGATLIASSSQDVAAWSLDSELELWSASESGQSWLDFGNPIGRLSVSPDGRLVAYGCIDGTIRCVDAETGTSVSVTRVPPSTPKPEHVTAVGFADDNRTGFAGLWDGTLCVVDLILGRELFRFPAHSKVITSVSQAPNSGDVLTSSIDPDLGGDNQFARVWRLLDLDLAPRPETSNMDARLAAFMERHGKGADTRYGHTGRDDLDLSFVAPAVTPTPADEPTESGPMACRARLRVALRTDPKSPQLNLDLAMVYLAANNRQKARDYLDRVLRFGGDDLIRDAGAQALVAESMLRDGRIEDAVPWLLRAGEGDEASALLQLGLLCMSGKGMPPDERRGAEYFRRSAEGGNSIAAYNLGAYHEHLERGFVGRTDWRMLAFGGNAERPPDSLVRAFEWYRRSAEAGYAPAQTRMGDFFAAGQVVGRDVAAAREWYTRAAAQGHEGAEEKLASLAGDSPKE